MAYLGVDTRWWNLAGAAALASTAACGPSIVLDADDGIGDADDGEDVFPDDGIEPDDDGPPPPPPLCMSDAECDPGFECIEGECIDRGTEDDYCQDGGCYCDDGYGYGYGDCCYGDCCYDGGCYEYECYDHEDCGPGALCSLEGYGYGQYCTELEPLPECAPEDVPALVALPLAGGEDTEVISLSFVDANGDAAEDLVIGRTGEATLLLGPGDAAPVPLAIPLGSAVLDVTAGDFNGDAIPDLAAALLPSGVVLMLGDGEGGFAPAPAGVLPLPGVTTLAALDFDGDDALDLAISGDSMVAVMRGDGVGGFAETRVLADGAGGPVVASVPTTQPSSVLAPIADGVVEWWGGSDADDQPDSVYVGELRIENWRTLAAGVGEARTLLSIGPVDGWSLLGINTDEGEARYRMPDNRRIHTGDVGDVDGNGTADFVVAADDALALLAVQAPGSVCAAPLPLLPGHNVGLIAVGDLDGNGQADIVTADGGALTLLQSQ